MSAPADWNPAGAPRPRTLHASAGLLACGSMQLSGLPGAQFTSGARRQRALRSQLQGQPRVCHASQLTGFPLSFQNLAALEDRSAVIFTRAGQHCQESFTDLHISCRPAFACLSPWSCTVMHPVDGNDSNFPTCDGRLSELRTASHHRQGLTEDLPLAPRNRD